MTTSAERLLETLDTDELIAYEKVAAKLAAAERSGELDLQGDARHQSPLPEEALPLLPPGLEPD
jgi:hypothetical protein